MSRRVLLWGAVALFVTFVGAQEFPVELDKDRKPRVKTGGSCFIKGGTILTGTGAVIEGGSILIRDGKIVAIGEGLKPPRGVVVIDARGKFITPGIIDAHSHIAIDATNEPSESITAEVRIHDVLNPDSLSVYRALTGGVTAALLLHGSANVIGGQSVVVKLKWKCPPEEFVIRDAPRIIKFALGENPKRSNFRTTPTRFPTTRIGIEAVLRRAFEAAKRYMAAWERYEKERKKDPSSIPPRRDLRLEALAEILRGNIWVHCHAYRADEMLMLMRLAKEYGFKVAAFQHALEAYKIAPELKREGVGVSTFADLWAYKVEAYDAIPYNAALCVRAGIITSINSDSLELMRRLNLEAAKSIKYGGLNVHEALKLITLYPAIQLGIAHRTGTLEVGKDADIAIWDGHPFSVYAKCVMTLIEGEVFFQRRDAFGVDKVARVKKEIRLCPTDHTSLTTPPPDRNVYAIVGATLHPVTAPEIPDGVIVIADGVIKAIGRKGEVAIPEEAYVIDAKGFHVYPGMIDAGSQLGLVEIRAVRATVDTSESGDFQPDLFSLSAINPDSAHIATTRFNGITAALTRPTGGVICGQSALIHLSGWTPEEMVIKNPLALHINFPEPPSFPRFVLRFLTPEEIRRRRERAKERRGKLDEFFERAKRYAEAKAKGAKGLPYDPRLEAMVPYINGQRPVIIHVTGAKGIREALRFAQKFRLKVILAGAFDAWKLLDWLAGQKVPVIFGPIYRLPRDDYSPYDAIYATPSLLYRAGIKFCFQSASYSYARNLPYQAGIASAYGLPYEAALKAVTIWAAEILGVAKALGSLEVGKTADLLVTDGDPLDITTNLHYLFIDGKPVPLENRHTQLYRRYLRRIEPRPLSPS